MSATTTPETPEVRDVLDRALKLSAAEREMIAREPAYSLYPELRASVCSTTELSELLRAKPDAVATGA